MIINPSPCTMPSRITTQRFLDVSLDEKTRVMLRVWVYLHSRSYSKLTWGKRDREKWWLNGLLRSQKTAVPGPPDGNKKLSCRRETAWCFMSLNILLTHSRSLKVIQTGTNRKLGCCFLFSFHSNYGSILHDFRDIARYWSKIVIFRTSLHSMPPLGRSPSEYCHPVWCGKTRMVGLPKYEKVWLYV